MLVRIAPTPGQQDKDAYAHAEAIIEGARPASVLAGTLEATTKTTTPLLVLTDGVTAPDAIVGVAQIYVDVADGDLKVIFGDGVVKVLAADTE